MYNESRTPKIFLEPVPCHAQTLRQDLGNVVLSEVWTLPTVSVGFFRGQNLGQMGEVLGDLVNWKKLLPYGKLTVCYWKWTILNGDLPIQIVIFQFAMLVYQRVGFSTVLQRFFGVKRTKRLWYNEDTKSTYMIWVVSMMRYYPMLR